MSILGLGGNINSFFLTLAPKYMPNEAICQFNCHEAKFLILQYITFSINGLLMHLLLYFNLYEYYSVFYYYIF